MKQKLEQTVEAIKVNPLERVQRRAVEQSVSLFERLEDFDKRLEMSLARRAENDEMIKEIGILLEEKKRAMRKQVSPDFEQEEWDQEDIEYLRYELEAEEEYA